MPGHARVAEVAVSKSFEWSQTLEAIEQADGWRTVSLKKCLSKKYELTHAFNQTS